MKIVCDSSIKLGWFTHGFNPPDLSGVFLAKLTCRLRPDARAELLEGDEAASIQGDVQCDDTPTSPLKVSTDFAPWKPRAEVLLHATAYSPTGSPEPSWTVRVRVGDWSKSLRVFGDRKWELQAISTRATDPKPVIAVPIDYRLALGAAGAQQNPIGRGLGMQAEWLPNVEQLAQPVRSPRDDLPPAGFGPLDASWLPRSSHRGTYDDVWLKTRWPWLPADFNYAHFNTAPLDQQFDKAFEGDEQLSFENLHPRLKQYNTRLPGVRVRCFVSEQMVEPENLTEKDFREVPLALDTIQIDLETEAATLLFRGNTRVQSLKMFELQTVFMTLEQSGQASLQPVQWLAKFKELLSVDQEAESTSPEVAAAEEAEQQAFEVSMLQLESEHVKAMQELDQRDAEARENAIAKALIRRCLKCPSRKHSARFDPNCNS